MDVEYKSMSILLSEESPSLSWKTYSKLCESIPFLERGWESKE